ncbi:hypothetical protein D9M68_793020 [compost metagenome]
MQGGEIGVVDLVRGQADLHREVEHGALARADLGLAVVHRHLVGHQRLFLVDAQDRAVRHHAVETVVGGAGGGDDHLAIALGEAAFATCGFGRHQRIVVGEEGTPLGRAARQRQEHVGHEAGFFLHLQDLGLEVLRQGVEVGQGVAGIAHGLSPVSFLLGLKVYPWGNR